MAPLNLDTILSTNAYSSLNRRAADSDGSSGAVIGGILGAILGTLVLLTILYKCCINNRSAVYGHPSSRRRRSSSTASSSIASMSETSISISGHRGGYLRTPERAYTKTRRSSSFGVDSKYERRRRRRQRDQRRATVQVKSGMMGFALRPERRYSGASGGERMRFREERKWYGDPYFSSRRTGDD